MTYSSLFGSFRSRNDVLAAVVSTLQTWTLTYLAEVERQEGLEPRTITPPGNIFPNNGSTYTSSSPSFRGGLDFETFVGDELPLLITVVQPTGDAERYEQGKYQQWYELQLAAIVEDPEHEENAQLLADRYGKALMGLITQQGQLGTRTEPDTGLIVPFAEKTYLVSAAKTEFLTEEVTARRFARSVVVAHTIIDHLSDESWGPRTPPNNPYVSPGNWPTVENTVIEIEAETPLGIVESLEGVNYSTPVPPSGEVIIEE